MIGPFIASLFRRLCHNLLLVSVVAERRSKVSSFSPQSLLSCVNHETFAFSLSSHEATILSRHLIPTNRRSLVNVIILIMILVSQFRRLFVQFFSVDSSQWQGFITTCCIKHTILRLVTCHWIPFPVSCRYFESQRHWSSVRVVTFIRCCTLTTPPSWWSNLDASNRWLSVLGNNPWWKGLLIFV